MALDNGIEITWLGHSTFKIAHDGQTMLIDPWVTSNPVCPDEHKTFERIDTILVTHGHGDHFADCLSLAKQYQSIVVCNFEIYQWLEKRGHRSCQPMNKGGSIEVNGVRVSMTNAFHSSSITEDDGSITYAGEPAGFVIEFRNRFKIYAAGDTCLFGDMALIGEMYDPDIAFLPIGDRFTMNPKSAAKAAELLGVKAVIPCHYGTFPPLTGTPDELIDLVESIGVEVFALAPGETLK
ncbi:MAG: metal-dependent hydrolase [Candidatus Poribacteria bacterium]|nr:metal-dependent hydrolase [Candidatus Poribacteria bacterium]